MDKLDTNRTLIALALIFGATVFLVFAKDTTPTPVLATGSGLFVAAAAIMQSIFSRHSDPTPQITTVETGTSETKTQSVITTDKKEGDS